MMVDYNVREMNQLIYSTEKMVPSYHRVGIVMVYSIVREMNQLIYSTEKMVPSCHSIGIVVMVFCIVRVMDRLR